MQKTDQASRSSRDASPRALLARLRDQPRVALALVAVGLAGFAARLVVAAYSSGTDDILTWFNFARAISADGLLQLYVHDPGFNHPPLPGYLAQGVLALSELTGIRFSPLFKLPMIAADALSGALVWYVVDRRSGATRAALAFAAYAWCPLPLLLSAHHGNTDSLCAMLLLLAVVLAEESRARFGAGLALGAAINVKLIPVLCIPALLLAGARTPRAYARFLLGLAVGAIPFAPLLLLAGDAFHSNALTYNSQPNHWGVVYLLRMAEAHPRFERLAVVAAQTWEVLGRWLIVAGIGLASLVTGPSRRLDGYSLVALSLALFLVFAPGFGVQYLVYLCPVLFARSPGVGFLYGCLAGLFVGTVYLSFWDGSVPVHTQFRTWFPAPAQPLGVLVWGMLVWLAATTLARACASRGARAAARP